jgi:hypothetical protein
MSGTDDSMGKREHGVREGESGVERNEVASNVCCVIVPFATVNNSVYCWITEKGVRMARNKR